MFNALKKAALKEVKEFVTNSANNSHSNSANNSHSNSANNSHSNSAHTSQAQLSHPPPQQYQTAPMGTGHGKHKALFIGINYFGQKGELRGCINDVKNVSAFLKEFYPQYNDVLVLTDDQQNPSYQPTRQNIENAMRWLVSNAQPGDSFFLHYSGHGGSVNDSSGDEADGKDESICPVDYASAGIILDDTMHDILFSSLPQGCKLTALFDSCHSGSVLDLPFTYSVDSQNNLTVKDNRIIAAKHALAAAQSYMKGDAKGAMREAKSAVMSFFDKGNNNQQHSSNPSTQGTSSNSAAHVVKHKTTRATAIQFSGCRDEQTSADAQICGQHTGAASWALMKVLKEHLTRQSPISYLDLLQETRSLLKGQYSQIPQLSTGFEMDMKTPFSLV